MRMTSKEIVQRAIHWQGPSRLPVSMSGLGVNDVAGMPIKQSESFIAEQEGTDEWGCVWGHTDVPNMGQVVGNPLEDIAGLADYPFPDYADDSRYVEIENALQGAEEQGKYISCGIFMVLFERMHCLHGFENTLAGLYTDRSAMEALADRIVEVHMTLVNEVSKRFPGRIHAWRMTDDWGTQQNSFISYDLWMDFFFPRYKRIFDAMHAAGCDVWIHSCGKINNIIEGYIRAGVDVVNLQQPRALGIEEIARLYKGRIAFESLVDIQATLPTDDHEKIKTDVADLMTQWADADGGFFFCDYGDDGAIGVTDKTTKLFMYETFSKWSEKIYGAPLPPPVPPAD